jgi:hypothetical protein
MLEHWPQGLQIGFPNSMVSFFQPWVNTRLYSSAFISDLGLIENIFSISALTPSVKPLRPISAFALIGMLDLG